MSEFSIQQVTFVENFCKQITSDRAMLGQPTTKAEEDAIKQKQCEQYLRELEENRQLRRKRSSRSKSPPVVKSKPVEFKATVRPLKNNVPAVKTHTETCPCAVSLPSTSKTCHCLVRIATKVCDVPQPVLLNVARQELNATVQRHRPKTDAASPIAVPDEDISKKYLIQ